MNNKRTLISIIISAFVILGSLSSSAQFRWGATAGINFNNLTFKQNDILTPKRVIGESGGIVGEMMFPGIGFGIQFGFNYEQLGSRLNMGDYEIWSSQGYRDERIYIHNIQIPFHLKFKYTRLQGLEDYIAPFAYGGPTFNIQAGHSKCDAMKFSGGDLGLTVGGGFEILKRWQIAASYTWGMTYVLKANLLTNYSARNRTVDIRLTYFF